MLALAWLTTAAAGPEVDARASAALAYLQFDHLWVGDPILGGFDGRSSPSLANRFLLSPMAEVTARHEAHRVRLRVNGRTLQRATVLGDDLAVTWTITSDGVPVELAVQERAFVDEASWRWRPDPRRAVDLRLGVLPFAIASGRLLVESWPGARARVDLGRLGGPPVELDLRGAVRTDASLQAALAIRRRWSAFEHLGLEVAMVRDTRGLGPIVTSDPGLLLGAFGAANAAFLANNGPEVEAWITDTYFTDDDGFGLARFLDDTRTYLDIDSRATLAYGALTLERLAGPVLIDAALIGSLGSGEVSGRLVPPGIAFEPPGPDWPTTAPAADWTAPIALRAGAFDLEVTWLAQPVGLFAFFQGASGDPDVVSTVAQDEPIGAFLAADQAFVRTRLFPIDSASRAGATTLPPGVGGHGLIAVGGGFDLAVGPLGARLQAALPWATAPSCLGCTEPDARRSRYGGELDLLAWGDAAPGVRPVAEGGLFVPGPFFLDDTDPARDTLRELPVGWRLYAGLSLTWDSVP